MQSRVAIIGAGFAGIEVLRVLQKELKNKISITIFNPRTDFFFTPLLHEAATGGVTMSNIAAPVRSFLSYPMSNFVCETVTNIDLSNKRLYTNKCSFDFDYLVIATGSESNTYNVQGAKEYGFFLKTVNDAIKLRKQILMNLEKYHIYKDPMLLNFTIIGGGSTGVELALEIDEYIKDTLYNYYKNPTILLDLKINIVCVSEKVLQGYSSFIQETTQKRLIDAKINLILQTQVLEISEGKIATDVAGIIETGTIIWCGGVKSVLPDLKGLDEVKVNSKLQLMSDEKVFILGDCINYGTSTPMDAQSAVKQAHLVARNIKAHYLGNKLQDFVYKSSGNLLSLGRWNAVGQIGFFKFRGALAWWVWRTIYLFKFPLPSKRIKIAIDWTVSIFSGRDVSNV